jgi:Mg2+ and Co2+ transporter CorA
MMADLVDEESPLLQPSTKREGSIQSNIKSMIHPLPIGMQIRCHLIRPDGDLEECSPEQYLKQQQLQASSKLNSSKKQQHYWIDIDAGLDQKQLKNWLIQLNLPHFVVDILASSPESWASQVIPLQRAALAFLRILPNLSTSDDLTHLAALHMRTVLLTFTSSPQIGDLYMSVLERMKQRLPAATSSGALVSWLGFHVDRVSQETRKLRYTVLAMDESLDRDISSVELEEIIEAKDQVLRLLSVAEEQTECLESLTVVRVDGLDETLHHIQASLSILLASARATERLALRLEKHIVDLRQRCEGHEQEIMNRRLALLTVLSAVFLPLTLFTGIWGMNFQNMPELDEPYAYPSALAFMLIIAALMIFYFYKTGWFR